MIDKNSAGKREFGRTRGGFEVASAYVIGVLLPVSEAARRRTNFDDIPGYIDDFIIGALLLGRA
jgi:hypothetical protein